MEQTMSIPTAGGHGELPVWILRSASGNTTAVLLGSGKICTFETQSGDEVATFWLEGPWAVKRRLDLLASRGWKLIEAPEERAAAWVLAATRPDGEEV